jgi:hypothetical protein
LSRQIALSKKPKGTLAQEAKVDSLEAEMFDESRFRQFLEDNGLIRFFDVFFQGIKSDSPIESLMFEKDKERVNIVKLMHGPKEKLMNLLILPENCMYRGGNFIIRILCFLFLSSCHKAILVVR